jgi:uncharacterized DUF497 family protein
MLQDLPFLDFEWDAGNWPKCAKHGLSREEIEAVFGATPFVIPARTVTPELRYAAIGRTPSRSCAFIVFTLRMTASGMLIRPISARYMHEKEVQHYESFKGA